MWACKMKVKMLVYTKLFKLVLICYRIGINIPTGKDSLSMKQKYRNDEVIAPEQ
jgi:phosphoribosylformylglycinamidine synthase